ncbi:MAG: hypothetical protein JWO37_1648, partial [Acidimicrobiales bacterium]|nr:hypothetical protein [Acidimicrobiales bacterium]
MSRRLVHLAVAVALVATASGAAALRLTAGDGRTAPAAVTSPTAAATT